MGAKDYFKSVCKIVFSICLKYTVAEQSLVSNCFETTSYRDCHWCLLVNCHDVKPSVASYRSNCNYTTKLHCRQLRSQRYFYRYGRSNHIFDLLLFPFVCHDAKASVVCTHGCFTSNRCSTKSSLTQFCNCSRSKS